MRLLKFLAAITLCLTLSIVAYAHPGGTDSSGGHTNHDTGEYHYHHGYSAHQHTDTDGDGVLDCPYRITGTTEKTNSNSSASSASSGKTKNQKEKVSFEAIALSVCGVVFVVGFIADLISAALKRKRKG